MVYKRQQRKTQNKKTPKMYACFYLMTNCNWSLGSWLLASKNKINTRVFHAPECRHSDSFFVLGSLNLLIIIN